MSYTNYSLLLRIQHYANQSDIQMAGMLSCAFSYRSENPDVAQTRLSSKSVNVSVSMLNLSSVEINILAWSGTSTMLIVSLVINALCVLIIHIVFCS